MFAHGPPHKRPGPAFDRPNRVRPSQSSSTPPRYLDRLNSSIAPPSQNLHPPSIGQVLGDTYNARMAAKLGLVSYDRQLAVDLLKVNIMQLGTTEPAALHPKARSRPAAGHGGVPPAPGPASAPPPAQGE
jgi:hypothetical protein